MTLHHAGRAAGPARTGAAPSAPVDAVAAIASAAAAPVATVRADTIVLSERALAMLRAGFSVAAYVMRALESMRRSVRLPNGRVILCEGGFYS